MFDTPILFLIFNRPDPTKLVFEEIRKLKPKSLYIAADGPREGNSNDIAKCAQTRKLVETIDWNCEVKRLYRDENLGCGKAISSAITWFFDIVEMGIILEDDCLPHPHFFAFCETMLKKYKDIDSIKFIGGTNYQIYSNKLQCSYYFSSYSHVWGWATWRRVWKEYDFSLKNITYKKFKNVLNNYSDNRSYKRYWKFIYKKIKHKLIDTWDFQLSISILYNNGLSIIPNNNLIKNLGFSNDATHTFLTTDKRENLKLEGILPIIFNEKIEQNKMADNYYFKNYEKNNIRFYDFLKSKLLIFYFDLCKNEH
jgi:hypothetical protein